MSHPASILSIIATGAVLLAGPAVAQEEALLAPGDQLLEVRLEDGSTLYGRVVSAAGDAVMLETPSGATVTVDRARVISVAPVRGTVHGGGVWNEDRVRDRLFATPTGRTLAGGAGHAGFQELFFPYVTYGIVDRLQVTAGTTILPEIVAELWYVAPKVGIVATPNVQLAAGAAIVFLTGDVYGEEDEGESFGTVHASLTLGPAGRVVNLAVAVPYLAEGADDDLEFADKPLFLVGGEYRFHRSAALVTDNAFVPGESGGLLSGGVRLMGERLSADLGVALFVDQNDWTCCGPIVNVQWAFGGGRPRDPAGTVIDEADS
ncbi:MAG TPA: hypothetical protein VJ982_00375 [Gemmatimonadota bacterium]|nr:hypothetical protein [Gemmatimonadota bacterium]